MKYLELYLKPAHLGMCWDWCLILALGSTEGSTEGSYLGSEEGFLLGTSLGLFERLPVGQSLVGDKVGAGVGLDAGS